MIQQLRPSGEIRTSGDKDHDRILHLVAVLRNERVAKKLTLRYFSAEIRISITQLSRLERGFSQPTLIDLLRWCRALGLDFETQLRDSNLE